MAKAVHKALSTPNTLVLVVAEQRQSNEDLRKARELTIAFAKWCDEYTEGKLGLDLVTDAKTTLEFGHGSRLIALPANEKVRGFSGPSMVVIDEAAYLDDEVFVGLDPMLEVSRGQLIIASTPNGTCYSEDTDIMTERGWKKVNELSYDDKIACLINDKVEYHHPLNLQVISTDSFINLKSSELDLLVTLEHRLWVKIQKGKWKFILARDILGRKTDLYFKKDFPWQEGRELDYVTIPSYSWVNKFGKRICRFVKPEIKIKADDFLEFLGYWLSEGGAPSNYYVRSRVDLTQVNEGVFNKMLDCVKRLSLSFRVRSHGNGKRINIYCSQLNRYLINMKKEGLPNFIKCVSKRQLKILLDAFYEGDGDKTEWRRMFVGIYPKLADDMQEIVLKLGYASQILYHKKNCLIVTIGKDLVHKFKTYDHPASLIEKKALAYCCTVPNGLVYVRRSGKPCWCGNSGFYAREWGNPRYVKIQVPWWDCPRIDPKSIEMKKVLYGEAYVAQEYETKFLDDVSALFTERALRASIDEDEEVLEAEMKSIHKQLEGGVELI